MLPRVRSCVGKNLDRLPAACADSLTNEPLLFLYPRWFRKTIHLPQPVLRSQKRKVSTAIRYRSRAATAAETVEDGDHSVPIEQPDNFQQNLNAPTGANRRSSTQYDRPNRSAHDSTPGSLPAYEWRPFDQCVKSPVQENELEETRQLPQRAVPSRQKNLSFDPKTINGLGLARKLALTRSHHPAGIDTIYISATLLEQLTGTSGENIWIHHDGSGCLIHVASPSEEDTSLRAVSLIGTSRAREITGQYLNNSERKHTNLSQQQRQIGSQNYKSENTNFERVDRIPPPSCWNLKTFAEHVRTIISAQSPRGIERVLYPREDSFNKTVATVLIELFTNPDLRVFQSSFALRQALEFCSKRTDIAFAARSIWSAARQAGIVPDIACFNSELARCFRVGNSVGIAQYIDEMRSTHIEPNETTWVLFLKFLRTKSDRHHFMQLPGVREVADKFSKDMMVSILVANEFQPSDRITDYMSRFQETVNKAYGSDWLTSPVVQSMIEKCIRARAPQTVSKVLKLAAERSVRLDIESFASLWKAVAKTGWFEDLLLLLKMQPTQIDLLQSQKLTELAFRAAWRRCFVNTCRVLWHYAASHGLIRYTMLKKLSDRLAYNSHPTDEAKQEISSRLAVCMVGTDRCDTSLFGEQNRIDMDDFLQKLRSLTIWFPEGQTRHNQMQLVHMILERDMTAWQRFEPMQHEQLVELIERAHLLDNSWQRQGFLATSSQQDLLTEAIPIDLKSVPAPMANLASFEPSPSTDVVATTSQVSVKQSSVMQLSDYASGDLCQKDSQPCSRPIVDLQFMKFQRVRDICSSNNSPAVLPTVSTAIVSLPVVDAVLHYLGLAWQDV